MHRYFSIVALTGLVALATPAGAQATVSGEAVAETLFREATLLIREGNYGDACPKLEGSQKADPAGGTVLLLALCYEETGQIASAWLRYQEALSMARADRRDDRATRARERIAALEPRVSFVTVTTSTPRPPGFTVEVDGAPLTLVGATTAFPLDPGKHRIRAAAPGRIDWTQELSITADGTRSAVEIPPLAMDERAVTAARPPAATPPPTTADDPVLTAADDRPHRSHRRPLAVSVGLAGLATAGVGGYFGVKALDDYAQGDELCPATDCTSSLGKTRNDDAYEGATRANVLIGAGAALLVTGVVLYLTAPRRGPAASVRPTTSVGIAPSFEAVSLRLATHF